MQIFFTVVGSGGGYVKIYDEATSGTYSQFDPAAKAPNVYPRFKPDFSGTAQEDGLFTIPDNTGKTVVSQFRQPLSNVVGQIQVILYAAYGSRSDALASIRTFEALLEMKVHFQVIQDAEIQYYPNAVVSRYSGDLSGISCTHDFTFKSDAVTANKPAI